MLLFSRLVGKLHFAFSVERAIEGEHAGVHKSIRKAPNHSVPFVSLKRRLPHLRSMAHDPEFFSELSAALQTCRNPKLAANALGMSNHVALSGGIASNWDPIFAQVIYRADPASAQSRAVPIET